jgi:hypothetical protein
MPAGRPSLYTPELGARLCELLADGELLVEICNREDMPSLPTVARWRGVHAEFRDAYETARLHQAQVLAERAVLRARQAKDSKLGRLSFDADRWLAGRIDPANYGNKVLNEVQNLGADGKPVGPGGVVWVVEKVKREPQ